MNPLDLSILPPPQYVSRDGTIALYRGDCRDLLPLLPKGAVQAVVTDPPYGLGVDYGDGYSDDEESWLRLMTTAVLMMRAVAPLVVCFTGITALHALPKPDWIAAHVWRTTGCYGNLGINQWMPIAVWGSDVKAFGSINGVLKSDVLAFAGGDGIGFLRDTDADDHPCPKPLNVMLRAIERFSFESQTILDPFLGSGTTAVACIRTGRCCIGIEISEAYFNAAVRRVEAAIEQRDGGPLFAPLREVQGTLMGGDAA